MIVSPSTNVGGSLVPSSGFPEDVIEMSCTSSQYKFVLPNDAVNPDPGLLSDMPRKVVNCVTSNVFSVPSSFVGLHFHRYPQGSTVPAQPLTYSSVRTHDGGFRWQQIETSKGVFNWAAFDIMVATHTAAGRDILFTIFGTPAWASARPSEPSAYNVNGLVAEPANMTDLADFVDALMVRAAGRIKYFEVWNEVNLTGFYTGTQSKLSEMTRVVSQRVKAAMPSAKIVSASVTGLVAAAGGTAETYLTNYMNASDGASGSAKDWIDIVGVHLYCSGGTFANIPGMVDRVRASMATVGISAKPVWDTESGTISPDALTIPQDRRRRLFAAQMILSAAKGVERVFWYSYDHLTMGFYTDSEFHSWRETFLASIVGKPITSVVVYQSTVYANVDGRLLKID